MLKTTYYDVDKLMEQKIFKKLFALVTFLEMMLGQALIYKITSLTVER